jgi:hypothetical protein
MKTYSKVKEMIVKRISVIAYGSLHTPLARGPSASSMGSEQPRNDVHFVSDLTLYHDLHDLGLHQCATVADGRLKVCNGMLVASQR